MDSGSDSLDPFLLKLAADLIAEPLTRIFNLSLSTNKLPKVWKSAFVLSLLKGGEPSIVNNYLKITGLSLNYVFWPTFLKNWSVIN